VLPDQALPAEKFIPQFVIYTIRHVISHVKV
jgi:hypothetical protein